MNHISMIFKAGITSLLLIFPLILVGQNTKSSNLECACKIKRAKFVTVSNPEDTIYASQFFPKESSWNSITPILSTTIKAKKGCLFAHFSAEVAPTDSYAYFYITVSREDHKNDKNDEENMDDEKALYGHFPTPSFGNEIHNFSAGNERRGILEIPKVLQLEDIIDPNQRQRIIDSIDVSLTPRMVSHSLAAPLESPGKYTIKVYYAGCCTRSTDPEKLEHQAPLLIPTLTLHYR